MATNTTDLIASKTAEYSNLPGLILGLDGWILRSLPADHRAQFLRGYEKVLRIVFHPDRYQDPTVKESRQRYLQSVNEAVEFMLSDAFSYDIATDSVPSHKNPMVGLRAAVQVRDDIITRIDQDKAAAQRRSAASEQELAEARMTLERYKEELDRRSMVHYQLNRITSQVVQKYPVPIDGPAAQVTGHWLTFRTVLPPHNPKLKHPCPEPLEARLAYYASQGILSDGVSFLDEWAGVAEAQGLLGEPFVLNFKAHIATHPKLGKVHILGAMTVAHLCYYASVQSGYRAITPEEFAVVVAPLSAVPDASEMSELPIRRRCLSFYGPGMILVLRCPDRYRLLLVAKVDAAEQPNLVLINHYKSLYNTERRDRVQQGRKLRGQNRSLQAKHASQDQELKALKKELKALKKKVEKSACAP